MPAVTDYWPEDSHRVERMTVVLLVLVALLFVGAMGLMALRDHRAEERCERLGGQTWDSGQHCTLGGRVVSTRD